MNIVYKLCVNSTNFLSRHCRFIVRAAYPGLAISDVRHASAVDSHRGGSAYNMTLRAGLHRWDLTQFCDPESGQRFSELMG